MKYTDPARSIRRPNAENSDSVRLANWDHAGV